MAEPTAVHLGKDGSQELAMAFGLVDTKRLLLWRISRHQELPRGDLGLPTGLPGCD